MSADLSPDLQFEIAHLLVIDVVGYSRLLVNEQIEAMQELNRIVRETECFRAAEAKDKLIRLPMGDGMALLFFENLEQPVRCALEIAQKLGASSGLQVRMGIHSGPVNQIPDVNDRVNIAGAGINVAQRVLDCGDAGHILVSKHVADDLAQYRHWQPYLHDLGECEVKHGLQLHLFSLCKDGIGNLALPQKFKYRRRWKETGPIRPVPAPRGLRWAALAALIFSGCALAISFLFFVRHQSTSSAEQKSAFGEAISGKSIAILPFENLSDDKQNTYFADGVQDEILTSLAKVADLKVISRTSAMQYRNSAQRNLREIGQTLGVAHVVEGTVQRAGGRVRVSAQLIDARTDAHLWAEHYDREIADVFAIESELAEQIVSQLKSHLSPEEKAAIEQKPATDLAAHDLYIRAKALIETAVFSTPEEESLLEAIRLLNLAIERDSTFALAYYELAHAHDLLYFLGTDHTPARLATADAAVKAAIRLRPQAGESHFARAEQLYYGYRDYDGALKELQLARQTLPNDPEILELTGYILRRRGKSEEGLQFIQRALDLDPRNFYTLQQIALSYAYLRRYAEETAVIDRAIAVKPDDVETRVTRELVALDWKADPGPLHRVIDEIRAQNPGAVQNIADVWVLCAFAERDSAGLEKALRALGNNPWGDNATLLSVALGEGLLARLQHDEEKARAAFTRAREEQEKLVQADPSFAPPVCILGLIDAGLGRKKEALEEAQRAIDSMPVTKDSSNGTDMLQYAAIVAGWTGEKDLACERLSACVSYPSVLSYGRLKLLPWWDPLRGDPRFEKIVASLAPKE